jgi:hypothetical protein
MRGCGLEIALSLEDDCLSPSACFGLFFAVVAC